MGCGGVDGVLAEGFGCWLVFWDCVISLNTSRRQWQSVSQALTATPPASFNTCSVTLAMLLRRLLMVLASWSRKILDISVWMFSIDILNAWTRFTATPMNTLMPPEINNYLLIHVCVRSKFKTATPIDTHVQPEIIRHFSMWTLSMVIGVVVSNISCNAIYHCSSQDCFFGYRVWRYFPENHSTVYCQRHRQWAITHVMIHRTLLLFKLLMTFGVVVSDISCHASGISRFMLRIL